MTVQDMVGLISTVGFPVLACGAMAWYVKYTNDQHSAQLNNNTLAITKLCDKLEG